MALFAHTTTVRNSDVRDLRTHVSAVVVVAKATGSLRHSLIARILLARLIERAAAGHQAISAYCHQAAGTFGRPLGSKMKRFGLMWRSPRPCLAMLPGRI
jgi:hypothetical protein